VNNAVFVAQRAVRTAVIHLDAPPDRVFPLFSPLGERAWAKGWNPSMFYPASGEPEVGAVFSTPHHDGSPAIWTIVAFDPGDWHIAYLRVTPDSLVSLTEVRCAPDGEDRARFSITYTFTGLSEQGNAYIQSMTQAEYERWMASWEQAINHYLLHGRPTNHYGVSAKSPRD
jgi:hypothetical protein